MVSPNNFTFYGFPDECRNFDERHPLWNEMMGNLVRELNLAFTRVEVMKGSADKFVYFFGRIILEDFMEVALVCYHGYGVAASKLVRSMYEFTVTLRYPMNTRTRPTPSWHTISSSRTSSLVA